MSVGTNVNNNHDWNKSKIITPPHMAKNLINTQDQLQQMYLW